MTFRGLEYETILDMQRCLLVAEADEKVYELQLKTYRLQRDKLAVEETEIRLNIQRKFIKELGEIIEDILDKMDLINDNLQDTDAKIFQHKFIFGKTDTEICDELHISPSYLYNATKRIEAQLMSDEGKDILKMLNKQPSKKE